jgi:Amt family ammonium transporter
LTNGDASFGTQIYGILVIGGFAVVTTAVVWLLLKWVVGIRVSEEAEVTGLDTAELGMEAYPDFSKG